MLNTNFKPSALSSTVLLLCLLLSGYKTSFAEEINPGTWHQIEYIVFQQLKTDAHVLRYEDTPYPKRQEKQFSYLVNSAYPLSGYHYTRLPSAQMQLNDALKKLSRRRDIKVLDYGAWQQELISDVRIAPIKIFKQLDKQTSLFGELQIRKSRFTHAEFSLFVAESKLFKYSDTRTWFLNPQRPGSTLDLFFPLAQEPEVIPAEGVQRIYFNIQHLKESRRVKQGEVHYLDHPTLGVMVTINESAPPEHAMIYGNPER